MKDLIKITEKRKFVKVIWFVDNDSENEIRAKSENRSDFIFVKTVEEFEKNIDQKNYLVFSVEKLNYSDELLKLIRHYSNCTFHELFVLGKGKITETHAISRLENNIEQCMWLDQIWEEIN